ncbi:MAG: hypothetical protein LUG47_02215 [Clostridiales bacterium]|nr:hypothetical protein [Clostridiales bacterium]
MKFTNHSKMACSHNGGEGARRSFPLYTLIHFFHVGRRFCPKSCKSWWKNGSMRPFQLCFSQFGEKAASVLRSGVFRPQPVSF